MKRSPLVTRIESLADLAARGEGPFDQELPYAPPGFREYTPRAAIVFLSDGKTLGAVPLARAERRIGGRSLARAALVASLPNHDDPAFVEVAYRALIDRVVFSDPAPEIICLRVDAHHRQHVDILWRLALALDARCVIREERAAFRVDLVRGGRRLALALALPESPLRELSSWLAASVRQRGARLLVVVADPSVPVPAIVPRAEVRFALATAEELERRPRRFGLGLSRAPTDSDTWHFVGSADGEVVFRMTCAVGAPALRMVPPPILGSLATPVALITSAETDPGFRGRSIYPAALQWLSGWARDRGIGSLVLFIESRNTSSLRGAAKAGFTVRGETQAVTR